MPVAGAFGAQRAALEGGLAAGLGLRPAPLPEGVPGVHRAASAAGACSSQPPSSPSSRGGGPRGGAVVESLAFAGARTRLARATVLEAPGLKALNCVVFPDPSLEAPLLGLDLVSVGRGRALAGFDFHPLSARPGHQVPWLPALRALREEFGSGAVPHSGNFYPEDAEFFSDGMLLLKASSPEALLDGLRASEAFQRYLALYSDVLCAAPEAEDPAELEEAQARYCQWQREHDPAGKAFASLFGEAWAQHYEDEFLFPFAKKEQRGVGGRAVGGGTGASGAEAGREAGLAALKPFSGEIACGEGKDVL